MQDERSEDTAAGSILEVSDSPYLERMRLRHLWRVATSSLVPCTGCERYVRTLSTGKARRLFCDDCLAISTDMSAIRRAGKLLAGYGLTDGARAMDKALVDLRALMRANGGQE